MYIPKTKRRNACRRFYFSLWVIPLFCFAGIFRLLPLLLPAYLAALLHEVSHLLAAYCKNAVVREFAILPYGCRLTLENGLPPQTEALIASAGPLFNLVMCLWMPAGYFRDINFALLILNLLPVLPLDGGRLLFALLSLKNSEKKAYCTVRRIGVYIGAGLFFLGLILFAFSGKNVSLLILTACLLGHGYASDEALFAQSRTLCRILREPASVARTEEITARDYMTVRAVLEMLPAGRFSIVTVVDKSGNILGRFTQKQLANAALFNIDQTLGTMAVHGCP